MSSGGEAGEAGDSSVFFDDFDDGPLLRSDGSWYCKAYDILIHFLCKIKQKSVEQAIREMPLPDELCIKIYEVTERQLAHAERPSNPEVFELIKQLSSNIQTELETRMRFLHDTKKKTFCVHSADPYMNVMNYFKALKGEQFLKDVQNNDDDLLKNILPWLGLTDWRDNTGGRQLQLTNFKSKLKKFLNPNKGGIVANVRNSQSPQLTPEQLREARLQFFSNKHGGKRLNTKKKRKLRKCKSMKKSKRT